ncbi:hypothetical protein PHYBLDRAFT_117431, partial [Phycomyces blakesleeanus NRRL 1555(-)]
QTRFVRGRFIADNDMLVKTIMEQAWLTQSTRFGLLLDQEKAYNYVYPLSLQQVLQHFHFPSSLVDCICNLFFSTRIQVNVNGHIS